MSQEALDLVQRLLEPKRLSYIQEVVFLQSWAGKLYREIAKDSGYDLDYIKEVGAQLWHLLSEALGQRVSKKNMRLVLTSSPVGPVRLSSAKALAEAAAAELLEFPSGAVPLQSPLYLEPVGLLERLRSELTRPGSLVRIRGPRLTGKTSLVLRSLADVKQLGYRTLSLNFQQADQSVFQDLNRFLRWFCLYLGHQLQLEPQLERYWDEQIGAKVSCSAYLQSYLLPQATTPLVLALDEVNCLFDYPVIAQEFLPLLRSWYEEAAQSLVWQQMRLVVVHSTEVYVPLSISQSPFNIGLPLQLQSFNLAQIQDLAQRHQLSLEVADLETLESFVGGHPYLIRLALYWLHHHPQGLAQLLEQAPTQSGIYSHHLRRYWATLHEYPELLKAYYHVVHSDSAVVLPAIAAYRLESMGLVQLVGNQTQVSCQLYRRYFQQRFAEHPLA